MNLVERTHCPVCRHTDCPPFRKRPPLPERLQSDDFRITDSRYGQRWPLRRCPACHFVFADPIPDPNSLTELYRHLKDEEYSDERENRSRNFIPILNEIRRLLPHGKRLLDIGAASGIFLDLARAQGYEGTGVEPCAYLAAQARELYGLDLFRGTIEDLPEAEPFDCVTLLDLIEHLADPADLIRRCHSRLQRDGLLVVVTPDISSLAAKVAGERWWHYRLAHLQFFNRRSLEYLLVNSGFRVESRRRYAWHFSLHYLLSRLLPGLKGAGALQNKLKKLHLKLQLFDSLEVYARKV